MKKKYITPILTTADFGHVLILAGTTTTPPQPGQYDIGGNTGGIGTGDGSDVASKKGIWFEEEDDDTYPTEDRFWD